MFNVSSKSQTWVQSWLRDKESCFASLSLPPCQVLETIRRETITIWNYLSWAKPIHHQASHHVPVFRTNHKYYPIQLSSWKSRHIISFGRPGTCAPISSQKWEQRGWYKDFWCVPMIPLDIRGDYWLRARTEMQKWWIEQVVGGTRKEFRVRFKATRYQSDWNRLRNRTEFKQYILLKLWSFFSMKLL